MAPKVGAYEIVRTVGRGGMGVVYECIDPRLQRPVAVKVVRPHGVFDDDKRRERLVREARAIARISHPNVVQVFDAGTVGNELYIAMELVEGPTLRAWLREQRTPEDIVRVFVDAASGLVAAHAAGIVHRDFKPENVIVGRDGRPRVLDFGIAQTPGDERSTDERLATLETTSPRLTAAGLVLGTPAYMPPEQARGEEVDARSDQFSFCVALFEALWGHRPFSGSSLAERVDAVERGELREEGGAEVSRRVRAALRRGLQAEPHRRHESMNALVAALEPSRTRLHWVAAGGTLLAALGAGAAWQPPAEPGPEPCKQVGESIREVWNGGVDSGIREAFAAELPLGGEAAWRRVRAAVDTHAVAWSEAAMEACGRTEPRPTQCLDQQRRELQSLLDELIVADKQTVVAAPGAAASLQNPQQCLDPTGSADIGAERPRVAEARDALARASQKMALGKYEDAAEDADTALVAAERSGSRAVRADAHLVVGTVAMKLGRMEEAETQLERAVFLAQEAEDDFIVARTAVQLMYLAGYERSDFDAAERWNELARATLVRMGDDGLLEAERLNALGAVRSNQGRYDDAITALADALAVAEARLGPRHPKTLMTATNLGTLYRVTGQLDQARRQLEDALVQTEDMVGGEHPDVARVLGNLAAVHVDEGYSEKAVPLLERAVTIVEATHGPEAPLLASILSNLAASLDRVRRFDDALVAARRAVEIGEAVYGEDASRLAQLLGQLGQAQRHLGDSEESLKTLRRAERIKRAALGDEHPALAPTLMLIANALGTLDRNEEARPILIEARGLVDENTAQHQLITIALGQTNYALGDLEGALAAAEAGLAGLPDDSHPVERALAKFTIAKSLDGLGREPGRARSLAQAAYPALKTTRPQTAASIESWLAER